ncbi:MAG: hypothetical protein PHI68_07000 [Candidatus Cloacimonetes bacterium]|nr:hypothetical protein [Candidatus Cloacimonadota bacterium]
MKSYNKQVFLMLALALLGLSAYAVTYDQYPLGVYSYLCTQADRAAHENLLDYWS